MTYATSNPMRQLETSGFTTGAFARNGTRIYGYVTADLAALVETAGYFNANAELTRGDVIIAHMNVAAATTPVLKLYIVTQAIKNLDVNNVIALQTVTAG